MIPSTACFALEAKCGEGTRKCLLLHLPDGLAQFMIDMVTVWVSAEDLINTEWVRCVVKDKPAAHNETSCWVACQQKQPIAQFSISAMNICFTKHNKQNT